MADPTPPRAARHLPRHTVVHGSQWLVAILFAVAFTVLAIAMGWLPLCTKAAGMATLAASAVLVSLVELARRRRS